MGSFRKRLLALIIGLSVVTQTVTLAAVLASTRRTVEARAAEQLRSGGSLAEDLMRFRAAQLANGVSVLAADFGFREAVAGGDAPTILSAARNNAQRIGADMVLLLDTGGRVLVSTAPTVVPGAPTSLIEELPTLREQPNFRVFGEQAYQLVMAPVRTPETIAWVAMGFAVDDALAQRIRDLVGSQVEIVTHADAGGARVATTLPAAQRTGAGAGGASAAPGTDREVPHLTRRGGVDYLSFAQRLDTRGDALQVILLQPLRDVLAPYHELRDAMLIIDGVALLLAALAGAVLGRSATRPIGELVRAARRIEQGHYGTAVPVAGGEEFRSLSATFNTMQSNIAAREADIRYQAYHDPLTQLPNRAYLKRELEELSGGGGLTPAALLLLELRNLREINASLGHQVGDEVLREAARRLQRNVAADDLVARLGEAQFLVLARGCPEESALPYAGELLGAIHSGFQLTGVSLDLRLACGVCLYPAHGASADELLQRAQVALEDAEAQRTAAVMYRTGQDLLARRRLMLITDLGDAIQQNLLWLVYQPKVAMATRSVRSLEALVRWTHPQLGPVPPGEFVPLAESTGGSRQLTNWVLSAAVRQMSAWRRMGLEVELAVNLSAPDILDPDLSDTLLQLLSQQQVPPTSLLLEITESAVMRDPQLAARNMELLRVAGVRFSIDDFGTGHSSLSQLSVLPVDELKIDRSFIARADGGAVTIVTSTIELAHRMGLKVVAEGVEQPQAWNLLRRLGCDYAQGYLISTPLAASQVPAFIQQARELLTPSDSTLRQLRALEQLSGSGS